MNRVCVTGYGIIDALGNEASSNFDKLLDPYSYYRPTSELVHKCKIDQGLYPEIGSEILPEGLDERFLPRTMRYGMHAIDQALLHSKVPKTKNVGVFASSLTGGNEYKYDMIVKDKISPKKGINSTIDALCGFVSQYYGFEGINTCMYSACATGLITIDFAMKYVDEYDYVIAAGSDAGINYIDMSLFSSLKALSNDSKPFDVDRNGFVMAEGAGALILESEEKAKARGANIYAYLYPAGHASDAFDATAPSGIGAVTSMKKAIENGGIPDVVNAHGTSTPKGDDVEYDAILSVIDNKDLPIYSNKGKIGHTFAAAGVIETIYSIISMQKGIVPHTHNCNDTIMDIVRSPFPMTINKTLNNSFGFGGKCVSMVIERP